MQFCCTYTNVSDLLLYLVEVGGRLLRSGVLWKSLCIWPPAPGLLAFFMAATLGKFLVLTAGLELSNVPKLILRDFYIFWCDSSLGAHYCTDGLYKILITITKSPLSLH